MLTPTEVESLLWEAVGEVTETEIYSPSYCVGYRNGVGRGGVSWPAVKSREEAEQELERRKTEETGAPHGIAFWYIEERRVVARTTVVAAVAP